MVAKRTPKRAPFRAGFQYAVKVLCTSNIPGTSQTTSSVLPGSYQTAVNVHNPNDEPVRVRSKIVLGPDRGAISRWVSDEILPDALIRLDCETIARAYGMHFIHGAEGFLVIESTHSLDVTAVYTAGPVAGGVHSIDVEQIRERRVTRG